MTAADKTTKTAPTDAELVEEAAPWRRDRSQEPAGEPIEGELVGETPVGLRAEAQGSDSALAIREEGEREIAATTRTYSTKPKLDMKDLMIPKLRLGQGQTPEVINREANPGQWILMGHEASDEIEVVILSMGKARELRIDNKGSDDDRKVICRSADGEIGVGEPGGVCEQCPLSAWTGSGNKRKPPACSEIYSYQVYDATHQALAILDLQRTGTDAAKLINTMIATRGIGKFKVKLAGDRRENGRQVFFAPRVTPRPLTEEEWQTAQMFMVGGE